MGCRSVGRIIESLATAFRQCQHVYSRLRHICVVQCMTALDFSHRMKKSIEAPQCYAADGEAAAKSIGSVN